MPERLRGVLGRGGDAGHGGILLRLERAPLPQKINGLVTKASANGMPHVQVELGPRPRVRPPGVRITSQAWNAVERTAEQLWPDLDAFAEVEQRERTRIARTGRVAPTTSARSAR